MWIFISKNVLNLFVHAVYKEDTNSEIKAIQNGVSHDTKWRILRQ